MILIRTMCTTLRTFGIIDQPVMDMDGFPTAFDDQITSRVIQAPNDYCAYEVLLQTQDIGDIGKINEHPETEAWLTEDGEFLSV